jgi:hypothetical protein
MWFLLRYQNVYESLSKHEMKFDYFFYVAFKNAYIHSDEGIKNVLKTLMS